MFNGSNLFSYEGDNSLEFKVGKGEIIPGIDEIVMDMHEGQTREAVLPPEKAFGNKRNELVIDYSKELVPVGNIYIGEVLDFKDRKSGRIVKGKIIDIDRDNVKIDFNNPFAGKTIKFEVTVLEINR